MPRSEWTRRRFLGAGAGFGAWVAAGESLAGPRWLARLALGGVDPWAREGALADLLRSAPRGRYWVSAAAAAAPTDCLGCHEPGAIRLEGPHEHTTSDVLCQLCARSCRIADGDRGLCRARMNVGGELRSLVYGRPVAMHVDPIEKKPFYHFLPGASAFSLATSGCPLRCKFCQNWEISQSRPEDQPAPFTSPESLVGAATSRGAPVIAFTYNEPTVFTEYLTDVARAARPRRVRCVLVSCGFMNQAPLAEMCDVLDAIKIDLKGYDESFYEKVCGASLKPVLRSIRQIAAHGVHLELVNLVVPTLNDSPSMLAELSKWVAGEVGPDVPLHFTRFHPDYQFPHLPPTPVSTLERARDIARREGIRYAYVGNVPDHPGNDTYCPQCGRAVVERHGFFVTAQNLAKGRCRFCGAAVAGVWE
jgi:pyruvate formate lyase activating enzyme